MPYTCRHREREVFRLKRLRTAGTVTAVDDVEPGPGVARAPPTPATRGLMPRGARCMGA